VPKHQQNIGKSPLRRRQPADEPENKRANLPKGDGHDHAERITARVGRATIDAASLAEHACPRQGQRP